MSNYEYCKYCSEHFVECNGGTCDWCLKKSTEQAVASVETDEAGAVFHQYGPLTPIRMWVKWDKKNSQWFARVNVGGWKRGTTCDALHDSPTKAITNALLDVMRARQDADQ